MILSIMFYNMWNMGMLRYAVSYNILIRTAHVLLRLVSAPCCGSRLLRERERERERERDIIRILAEHEPTPMPPF